MNALHPTAGELEQYVCDMLGAQRASEIEQHVVDCDACAQTLADEARLELALGELAEFRARKSVTPLSRAKSIVAATLVAAAAVLLVFAGEAFNAPNPESPAPAVVAPPAADAGITTVAHNDSGANP